MKDLVIKGTRFKAELLVLAGCLVAAEMLNAYSVIRFGTPWYELFTQIGFVVVTALVFYVILWMVRLTVLFCLHIVRRIRSAR